MESAAALKVSFGRVWHALRCYWCEVLFEWSYKICPKDYCPSYIQAVIDARNGNSQ